MKPKILLVNCPVYDFSAYDFWLRPLGLLTLAGQLRGKADMYLFDYLDRSSYMDIDANGGYGKGTFKRARIPKPKALKDIPRYYYRFGLERERFSEYLKHNGPFDFAFVGTVMTYWYPGVQEVIEDIRRYCGGSKILLGGVYCLLCPEHARSLGADITVTESGFGKVFEAVGIDGDDGEVPLWEAYQNCFTGAVRLTRGCPFNCTYCATGLLYPDFRVKDLGFITQELDYLKQAGVRDLAFYDDALLFDGEVFSRCLEYVLSRGLGFRFHTPNAMHCRFINRENAELMVRAGFKSFYLGFESSANQFHNRTGRKVVSEQLKGAVEHLKMAGAKGSQITAYEIIGHPYNDIQQIEESMYFVHSLGIRIMLADFSPIPGTRDGDACGGYVDLSEPLNHNKTAFPVRLLGFDTVNYYKDLCRKLNREIC